MSTIKVDTIVDEDGSGAPNFTQGATVTKAGTAITATRTGSDGTILDLKNSSASVGSIGAAGANSYIGTGDTGLHFAADLDVLNPWNPSTNGVRDNAINLGWSAGRFKDLYLSGGVFLGGTGAANKLDDYEEGTWTPSLYAVTGGAITVSATSTGFYTKVGRLVHVSFAIGPFSVSGGTGGATINISGLPFTTQGSGLDSNGSVLSSNGISWSRTDFVALRTYDVSTLGFLVSNNGGSWLWETVSAFTGSNQHVSGTITYMTTA